jgi:hypothetical protein
MHYDVHPGYTDNANLKNNIKSIRTPQHVSYTHIYTEHIVIHLLSSILTHVQVTSRNAELVNIIMEQRWSETTRNSDKDYFGNFCDTQVGTVQVTSPVPGENQNQQF